MLPYNVMKSVGGLVLNASKTTTSTRNYARRILPVVSSVKSAKKMRDEEKVETKQIRKQMQKDIQAEFENDPHATLEPDLNQMGNAFEDYQRDQMRLLETTKRQKMVRKHFREFTEREYSVLTWAEKEKIRFLHNSDPEEWTPEALASVFPVTPEGAQKLMKSTFRAKSLKEIENHDLNVADRIKRIKSGEISMSADLEEKMKMRKQIPLKVGAIGPNDQKLLIKSQLPKVIGEFAALVTPARKKSSVSVSSDDNKNIVTTMHMNAAISNLSDPDVGDSYMLKDKLEGTEEMRRLNIHGKERMTFSEFETKIKQTSIEDSGPDQEIEYLRNFQEKEQVKPIPLSELKISNEGTKLPEIEDYLNYQSIPKYKPSIQNTEVNNSDNYSYNQNSFGAGQSKFKDDEDHIEVPQKLRRSGAVYRRGKSFYDENGDLMYSVV